MALFPLGGTGAKQVDVIPVDPSFEHWAALGDSSVEETGFVDFLGMTPIATVGGWFVGDPDGVCLAVVRTSDIESGSQSINGPFYSSCSAGPFRAVVQFVVTSDLPQEFLKRFPEGQAVQFVLDGERVGVFTPVD